MIDLKSVSRKGEKMKKKSIFLKSMHTIWIHYAEFISSNDLNLLMGACIRRRIFKFEDSWWQVIGDRWQMTRDMWHVTCDTWHVTHDIFFVFFLHYFFSFLFIVAFIRSHRNIQCCPYEGFVGLSPFFVNHHSSKRNSELCF